MVQRSSSGFLCLRLLCLILFFCVLGCDLSRGKGSTLISRGPAPSFVIVRGSVQHLALADDGKRGWAVGNGGVFSQLKNGGWRIDHQASALTNARLSAVWVSSKIESGWAVGEGGTILRLEEGSWHIDAEASVLTDAGLQAVWVSSQGDDGWAVGEDGTILSLEDGFWRADVESSAQTDASLRAVWASGKGDYGWAVGTNGKILRLENRRWRVDAEGSALTRRLLSAVWTDDESQVGWAVGSGGTILRLEDGSWRYDAEASAVTDASLRAVWTSGNGKDGWVVGLGGTILRLEDGRWRLYVETRSSIDGELSSVWTTGAMKDGEIEEGWAVGGDGTILRLEDGRWRIEIAAIHLASVWVSPAKDGIGWAVGSGGVILRLEDGSWSAEEASSLTNESLHAIWASDRSETGWAVGEHGTILRLEAGRWEIDTQAGELTDVDLFSVWASDHGDDGWTVGERGTILRLEAGRWEIDTQAGELTDVDLFSVWASPLGDTGWAAGARGTILRLEDGHWEIQAQAGDLTDHDLFAIWARGQGKDGWSVGKTILRLKDGEWRSNDNRLGSALSGAQHFEDARQRMDDTTDYSPSGALQSIWISEESDLGWAVGYRGSILRLADGRWHRVYGRAAPLTEANFSSVWAGQEGSWVVGQTGVVMHIKPGRIAEASLTPISNQRFMSLRGSYKLTFDEAVAKIREVELLDDRYLNQFTTTDYNIDRLAPREFKFTFSSSTINLAKRLKGVRCQLVVVAQPEGYEIDDIELESEPFEVEGPSTPWWKTPRKMSLCLGFALAMLLTISMHLRLGHPDISRWIPLAVGIGAISTGTYFQKTLDGAILTGVLGGWFALLVLVGTISPRIFRLVTYSQPFEWIGLWVLRIPSARKHLYADYVRELHSKLLDQRSVAHDESYLPLPARCVGPERIGDNQQRERSVQDEPDIFSFILLTDDDRDIRSHIYLEAAGGRGKSALLRKIVGLALDTFIKNPRSPLPVLALGGEELTVHGILQKSLGIYAFSPRILKQELEAGSFFLIFDDLRDGEMRSNSLGEFLQDEGRFVPLLLSSRPAPEYRRAVQTAHRWCKVEPVPLDDEMFDRFVSHYLGGGSPSSLAPKLRAVCRGRDGSYLPILVRLALMVDATKADSVADLYRYSFHSLLRGPDEELRDWLAARCVDTYWKTGFRNFPCAYEQKRDRDLLQRLLAAGVLVSADGGSASARTFPRAVRFFNDSMQSYCTAVGLFQSEDPWSTLWRAAGAPEFVSEDRDVWSRGESELFGMCVHVFEPKEQLALRLKEELLAWVARYEEKLSKRLVFAALSRAMREQVKLPPELGVVAVLETVVSKIDHGRLAELVALYGRLAPYTWPLREKEPK